MKIVQQIDEVRENVFKARKRGQTIGFVPTMGFLHKGHLSLVEISKQHCDYQVMSIFVNRLQFNDKNDFESYPKDLERDCRLADGIGVDLMFIPNEDEMYKENLTHVDVTMLSENLCGASRPGHFRGVFTVVSKLFNIVLPDISVFGQKDIQQAVSIEKMVLDLNFPVRIIIAPIIREDDGLAMSSRNKHLSEVERKNALSIYRSMKMAEKLIKSGEYRCIKITDAMKGLIEMGNPKMIDYISIVNYYNLQPVEKITGKSKIGRAHV